MTEAPKFEFCGRSYTIRGSNAQLFNDLYGNRPAGFVYRTVCNCRQCDLARWFSVREIAGEHLTIPKKDTEKLCSEFPIEQMRRWLLGCIRFKDLNGVRDLLVNTELRAMINTPFQASEGFTDKHLGLGEGIGDYDDDYVDYLYGFFMSTPLQVAMFHHRLKFQNTDPMINLILSYPEVDIYPALKYGIDHGLGEEVWMLIQHERFDIDKYVKTNGGSILWSIVNSRKWMKALDPDFWWAGIANKWAPVNTFRMVNVFPNLTFSHLRFI